MYQQSITLSYLHLRRLIGVIAIAHPIILYLGGLWLFGLALQPSMSDYYHTGMRDIFVGIDVCTGVFLLSYRGYDWRDRFVSALAGTAAIVVALFPVAQAGETDNLRLHIHMVHAIAAITFLSCLAWFCLVLFVRSDPSVPLSPQKKLRNKIYRLCGLLIIVVLLLIGLYAAVPSVKNALAEFPFIFVMELIAFLSFGVSWLVKGRAIIADIDDSGAV